jgi:DNA polymerase-3 subunit delta
VANASALEVEALIDAALAGRFGELETEFTRLMAAGTSLGQIVWAAQRQLSELHKLRLTVEDGSTVDAVMAAWPRTLFRRETPTRDALRLWTASRLADAILQLGKAALDARVQGELAEPITQRALMALASQAQALRKGAGARH